MESLFLFFFWFIFFPAGMGNKARLDGKNDAAVAPASRGRKNKVVDSATPSSLLPSRRINI